MKARTKKGLTCWWLWCLVGFEDLPALFIVCAILVDWVGDGDSGSYWVFVGILSQYPAINDFFWTEDKQVGQLNQFFISFLWWIIFANQCSLVRERHNSFVSPSNSLISVSNPWRAFWADMETLTCFAHCFRKLQRNKDILRCAQLDVG